MNKMANHKGFTLIELMIVIAIIGILAAIAIPQFQAYKKRSYAASLQSDAHSLANAEEAYFADNGRYTSASATLLTATYGASKGQFTSITAIGGDANSFNFTLGDNTHAGVSTARYMSNSGGLQ